MPQTHRVRDEFDVLYREHWKDTIAQARSILRGQSDPADVAATAFTQLWAEITEGRAEHLQDRLIELTRTVANTELSRSRRELEYIGYPNEVVVDTDPYETALVREGGTHAWAIAERLTVPPPTPETHRFAEGFDAAVRSLTPKQAEAFVLTELRGLSTVEAADVLGITQQATSARRARARAAVAEALTEEGVA